MVDSLTVLFLVCYFVCMSDGLLAGWRRLTYRVIDYLIGWLADSLTICLTNWLPCLAGAWTQTVLVPLDPSVPGLVPALARLLPRVCSPCNRIITSSQVASMSTNSLTTLVFFCSINFLVWVYPVVFDIVSAFFVLVFSGYSLSTTLRDMNEIWNNLSMIHEIIPAPRMSSVFIMTFH